MAKTAFAERRSHFKPRVPAVAYERDFYRWTQRQAALLRTQDSGELDWKNIAEEIESLGKRDRRELGSRLRVLMIHLLKWQFQPTKRSESWSSTIGTQREEIRLIIEDSPSLRRQVPALM